MTSTPPRLSGTARGVRAAQAGIVVNAALAAVKLVAGVLGNTYALVADAVESVADVVASMIVWGGLSVASQPADEDHPFGHGKAEALAAAVVSILLVGAAVAIAIQAVRNIRTPHQTPAPWTLIILVAVMAIKWVLSRRVAKVGADIGSTVVRVEAAHHLSDAITSAAAFIGITIALLGARMGKSGWEVADDWAALIASGVIAFNGSSMLRAALDDLMDRMPGDDILRPVRLAAEGVPGVLAVEKLHVRKSGMTYHVEIHAQALPTMTLHDAHALGGRVKSEIRAKVPSVDRVHVHMEPFDSAP